MTEPDDWELIRRSRNGDGGAFETLLCRYDRRVLGIALQYTGNKEDAKDIYQEVFLKVHRALENFRFESKFSTWLFRVTTNTCLTYEARRKKNRLFSLDGDRGRDGEGDTLSENLQTPPESERLALNAEARRQIEAALKRLSPQQRLIFSLRHFDGHKLREIAELLDCAEGTVKKHLFVATERMKEQLLPWMTPS